MKPLGTILPTERDFQLADEYAAKLEREKARIAANKLSGLDCRVMPDGEIRYHNGPNRYAIISSRLTILWFEYRDNPEPGWYASKPVSNQ